MMNKNEWISVKDRLPNRKDMGNSYENSFLCRAIYSKYGGIPKSRIIVLSYDYFANNWICENMIVTHWRQLPELPKVEEY